MKGNKSIFGDASSTHLYMCRFCGRQSLGALIRGTSHVRQFDDVFLGEHLQNKNNSKDTATSRKGDTKK
jgi:hypothetical protein